LNKAVVRRGMTYTPKHAKRPRHARSRRRTSRWLLIGGLLSLLGLVLHVVLPAGAVNVVDRPDGDRLAAKRVPKHKHASSTTAFTTTSVRVPTTTAPTTVAPTTTAPSASTSTSALEIGINWHAGWASHSDATNRAIADKMAAAGVTWARIDLGWDTIFPDGPSPTGQWYVDKIDRAVDYANSKGIKILGIWYRTPGWANGGRGYNYPPTNVYDYARSAQWAASHWKGRIQAWEVWNEPDPSQSFWEGSQDQYVALLKAGYPAFHQGDPNTIVVLGGPSSNDDVWLDGLYSRGGKGSFDVLATHPYQGKGDAPPEHPDDGHRWWFTHLPAVRNVMLRYGDGAKRIWFTEFGWSTHPNMGGEEPWQLGVTEQQQADYLLRAIKYTKTNYPYVTNMIWYQARDEQQFDIQSNHLGLLREDLSNKPAYSALREMIGPAT
jgi:polysaccharide biosynthesis protein PslG